MELKSKHLIFIFMLFIFMFLYYFAKELITMVYAQKVRYCSVFIYITNLFITARKRSCGKVMFYTYLSVILFIGGGGGWFLYNVTSSLAAFVPRAPPEGTWDQRRRGLYLWSHVSSGGWALSGGSPWTETPLDREPPYSKECLVCTLLECILVY